MTSPPIFSPHPPSSGSSMFHLAYFLFGFFLERSYLGPWVLPWDTVFSCNPPASFPPGYVSGNSQFDPCHSRSRISFWQWCVLGDGHSYKLFINIMCVIVFLWFTNKGKVCLFVCLFVCTVVLLCFIESSYYFSFIFVGEPLWHEASSICFRWTLSHMSGI